MRIKELLAFGRIPAGLASLPGVKRFIKSTVGSVFDLQMKIFGDVVDLLVGQIWEGRHTAFGAAAFNYLTNIVTLLVMQDERGTDKVRSLRTTRVLTVTGSAVLFVKRLAQLCGGGIGRSAKTEEIMGVSLLRTLCKSRNRQDGCEEDKTRNHYCDINTTALRRECKRAGVERAGWRLLWFARWR